MNQRKINNEKFFYSTDNKIKIISQDFKLFIEHEEYQITIVFGDKIIIYPDIYSVQKNDTAIFGKDFIYSINNLEISCNYQKNMVELIYTYSDDWGDGFNEELFIFKYNQNKSVWNREN